MLMEKYLAEKALEKLKKRLEKGKGFSLEGNMTSDWFGGDTSPSEKTGKSGGIFGAIGDEFSNRFERSGTGQALDLLSGENDSNNAVNDNPSILDKYRTLLKTNDTQTSVEQPKKTGALGNVLSGAGDIAWGALSMTKGGERLNTYLGNKKQQDFENSMSVWREINNNDPELGRKFAVEKLKPMVEASPELIENIKNSQTWGQENGMRRKLPAEWDLFTPEQQDSYLERYSVGGRDVGAMSYNMSVLDNGQGQVSPDVVESARIKGGLKPKAENPSSAAQTKLSDADQSRQAMKNLKSLYKSEYIGYPGKKAITGIKGYLGQTTKQQEDFRAATAAIRNSLIKQITGATMGRAEEKRILAQMPDENDPEVRWNAKYDQTLKNIDMLENAQVDVMKKSNVDVSGFESKNVPTAEELRKLNTPEAYQQGIELGYWQ